MSSLESISNDLSRAELQFLAAAERVPPEQWKTCPGEGRWSAGELVGHLITVERLIILRASKLLQHHPTPRPFLKRFHLPMFLVEAPSSRAKRLSRSTLRSSATRAQCSPNSAKSAPEP